MRKIFRKSNTRNVSFSENFAYVINEYDPLSFQDFPEDKITRYSSVLVLKY